MFRRLYDPKAIEDALTRRPSKALKDLLTEATVTQSMMEDRFLTICRRHHLPQPHTQHRINAKRYDFAWPQHKVVVETDSWLATDQPLTAGWLVLRFTWADLTRRSRNVAAATVKQALTR